MNSFVSSGKEEELASDESANAGMEITVQNSYFRRLQFFNGQTELMGHVWSGTASELTPAYTATTLLHDHDEIIQLHNGVTITVEALSSLSIDLKGSVQMSLWYQNAQSNVIKK